MYLFWFYTDTAFDREIICYDVVDYSSHSQVAPPQIAPSPEIAPVFWACIVVQFGDLAQKNFQIEVC